jgi:hypothetical protein
MGQMGEKYERYRDYISANWRFNSTARQWTPLLPAQNPPGRAAHALSQAPCTTRQPGCSTVLLFGGLEAGLYKAETWIWDGLNWARPQLTLEPSARIHPALAFDAARNETVLFGGFGQITPNLSDTWIWSGSQWQQRVPAASPPPMQSYSMAYDPLRAETILVGVPVSVPWFETWAWNGMTWLRKTSGFPPSLVKFGRLAYDGASGEMVLYGGTTFLLDSPTDEVWTWNGTAWTPRIVTTNPGRRIDHSMTTDSAGQIIMFGGTNGVSTQRYSGIWIWQRPEGGNPRDAAPEVVNHTDYRSVFSAAPATRGQGDPDGTSAQICVAVSRLGRETSASDPEAWRAVER